MDSSGSGLLVPINEVGPRHLGGLGRTKVYELVDARELIRVNIGRRSFVTMQSIRDYVNRLGEAAIA